MPAISRDVERQVRAFSRQKLDPLWISHYLMETYGLDIESVRQVFIKVGLIDPFKVPPKGGGKAADPLKPAQGGMKKQSFY